ncbi:hypothetical protein A9986_15145 [Solibacillus silvestris]|nr:pilus assembly PilX N-terminal domain-containing protein [Solibacillus silvestris]OBW53505.1 hypothetical protein A9986_15145 [Solibacillus silvestris]
MKKIQQEHGYTLIIVTFAVVLISVIGLGLLTINANSLLTSKNEKVDQSVYYIAEAGLNVKIEKLLELSDLAYESTIIERKSKFQAELDKFPNLNYCGFAFTFNFDEEYKNNFLKIYTKSNNLAELKADFFEFPNPDPSSKKATFEINHSQDGGLFIEVKSTGYLQNQTRKLAKKVEIKSDGGIDTLIGECNTSPPENNNPPLITTPTYPNSDGILKPPSHYTNAKVGIYVANRKESNIKCHNKSPNASECWTNGNGTGFAIGNLDKSIIENYLPTTGKYSTLIQTLKETTTNNYDKSKKSGIYIHDFTTKNFSIDAGSTLTLIVTSEQFMNLSTLSVTGGGTLNLIVTGESTKINGTINSTNSKVNLILEGTPDFSGKDFNYSRTNIIALNSKPINLSSQSGSLNGGNLITSASSISVNSSSGKPNAGICAPNATYSSNGTQTLTSIVVNTVGTIKGLPSNSFNPSTNPCELDNSFFDLIQNPPPNTGLPAPLPSEVPELPDLKGSGKKYILKQTYEI